MKRFVWILPLLLVVVVAWFNLQLTHASVRAQITLNEGQKVTVVPNGCVLSVLKTTTTLVKVKCVQASPIGDANRTTRPEVKRTLTLNQTLKIKTNNCNLQVNKQTAQKVVVVCKPKTTTVQVGQNGFSFSPQQVNIKVGDTVHWDWVTNNHTVTSGTAPNADNVFCSPNNVNCGTANPSNSGATYERQFNTQGTFQYFCKIHGAGMSGTVTVNP